MENGTGRTRAPFKFSKRTLQAVDELPSRMKTDLGPKQIEALEINLAEPFRGKEHDLPPDAKQFLEAGLERFWKVWGDAYEDVLGSPMPSAHSLIP